MIYNNRNGELSILAHHRDTFYKLQYDSKEDKTIIKVRSDTATKEDGWSAEYEVVYLCPVSRRDYGRLDCCAVLDKDFNVVAFSESSDWVNAFVDGIVYEDDECLKAIEQYFSAVIRQLHTGVVDHVGQ